MLPSSLQRYGQALGSYFLAIAIDPKRDEAWYNRGNALSAMRLYQEAEKSYDKAIAIKPDKYSPWINRGIALTQLQRYEQEECILRQSDRHVIPDKHQAYYNKACTYALQKNTDQAIAI
ncbi:MAG: tetratricopeptide repeat protein [Rivularia sp. (in: cyanobacteria)]